MTKKTKSDPAAAAELFIIRDQVHEPMHDRFLWATMQRRDQEAAAIPEWEELREIASKIKEHTLTHLDRYLEEFETNATRRGAHVHWARDAAEHNSIVYSILEDHGVKELIKSKSMLQEECGMAPFLKNRGIKVIESDLGERIQQLDGQPPSHIVFPSIHKTRQDVAELFARTIGTDPNNDDPHFLTEVMRNNARPRFLSAGAGMTAVILPSPRRGPSWFAPMRAMRISGLQCRHSILQVLASKSWCREWRTWVYFSASSLVVPRGLRSHNILPISAARGRGANYISCLWTTGEAAVWECPISGIRSSAFVAAPA